MSMSDFGNFEGVTGVTVTFPLDTGEVRTVPLAEYRPPRYDPFEAVAFKLGSDVLDVNIASAPEAFDVEDLPARAGLPSLPDPEEEEEPRVKGHPPKPDKWAK